MAWWFASPNVNDQRERMGQRGEGKVERGREGRWEGKGRGKKGKGKQAEEISECPIQKPQSFYTLISEITSLLLYSILKIGQVQPSPKDWGVHKNVNTGRWGPLEAISEAARHHIKTQPFFQKAKSFSNPKRVK